MENTELNHPMQILGSFSALKLVRNIRITGKIKISIIKNEYNLNKHTNQVF